MRNRNSLLAAGVLGSVLLFGGPCALAFDESRYPDWTGQWLRVGGGQGAAWDPTKPGGLGQQAPLTPEYQALFEANLKDQAEDR